MEIAQQASHGYQRSIAPHLGCSEVVSNLSRKVLDDFLGTVIAEPVRARRASESHFAKMREQALDGDAPGAGRAPDQAAFPDDSIHAANEHFSIFHEARLARPDTVGSRVPAIFHTVPALAEGPAAPAPPWRLPPRPVRLHPGRFSPKG
ncbi:hypothetical protein [Wenjunlia tyrosinilytica]|nr:hypothetical protein [Wenjunlia tyrosinilytica]